MESVSVALCSFNGSQYIEEQLASIFKQTKLPNEIVVSDDGSTDDTVNRLYRVAQSSPVLMRIMAGQPNVGVTSNFERAITACNGSVIVLADQDDIWREDKIQRILDTFAVYPGCGYVFSDASLIDADGNDTGNGLWATIGFTGSRRYHYDRGDQLQVMLKGGNFIYGMTLAFRSRLRSLVLPFVATSTDCTHDTWISTLLSAADYRGVGLSDALVAYRQHSRQVVGAGQFKASSWRAIQSVIVANHRPDFNLANDYDALAERLLTDCTDSSNVTMLAEKALHLRKRRAIVGSSRMSRLPIIVDELFSGRYARYSSSWLSVLRDFVTER